MGIIEDLVVKSEGKPQFGRSGLRRKDYLKITFKEEDLSAWPRFIRLKTGMSGEP
jgi:hypothetical protein